jgi:hypothetical protein
VWIERQDPIGTVDEQEPRLALHRKATRIGNARVIAEHTERRALVVEGEQNAIAVTIRTTGTRYEQAHAAYNNAMRTDINLRKDAPNLTSQARKQTAPDFRPTPSNAKSTVQLLNRP